MDSTNIIVRGAREHNLQNVDLELPRNRLICFTGVSGSGKSSLAFDTLYAEGQRRYVESLSSYARQFLGQLQKPDVDFLAGLSPSISIQQKTAGKNPRSTVGTITEIHDYLRVLFARVGQGHCSICDRPITAQSREQILDRILVLPAGTKFLVLAPVVRGQKGEYKDLLAEMLQRGYLRARVDGQVVRLTDDLKLDRRIKHDIAIVIDRLTADSKQRTRLAEAVEQALALADGNIVVAVEDNAEDDPNGSLRSPLGVRDIILSAHYACTHCNKSYEPPSPQLFSFNSPHGMCLDCDGLGTRYAFDRELLIPDPSKSFYDGAIPIVGPLRGMGRWRKHIYEGVGKAFGIDLKAAWSSLPPDQQDILLNGAGETHIAFEWKMRGGKIWKHGGTWEGIIPQLLSSFKKTAAGPRRLQLEKYMRVMRCPTCHGHRLNAQARSVRVAGRTLIEAEAMPIGDLADWLGETNGESRLAPARRQASAKRMLEDSLDATQRKIAQEVLKEIRARVRFLLNVGLHYLSLDRTAPTLSGGEAQRIRLAGQIGSGLVGVLYILDEPSIGLHPRDNDRLLRSLEQLRDMGNTVLVVEHDEDTMRAADHIVDFGPGPGVRGGHVVASGSYEDIVSKPESVTGQYLSGAKTIAIPQKRRMPSERKIAIVGARHNNLKNVTVDIPLGLFVSVTGVSGSGKSSLINDVLRAGLQISNFKFQNEDDDDSETEHQAKINNQQSEIKKRYDAIQGHEQIDKIIDIDQSPIGRTPRSNPGTYIKVFDQIRDMYALVAESKVRGYKPGRFSFNRPGGRCEACEGNGSNRLEMDFLADVWVKCPVCEGHRFNRETLQVRFKDKNIHDVLEMDVQEALEHFVNIPKIHEMLKTLHDVGLDYIKIGQPSPTLSGGEAQRVKLAKELCRRSTGKTLYILDEPTTGLHFDDIQKLLQVLHGFVDAGNTVLVIEHNLDVIKTSDWIIDLGPEGGAGGGTIVCAGTPETVAQSEASFTGQALRELFSRDPKASANFKPSATESARARQKRAAKRAPIPQHTHLTVQGAREHNLKNLDVELPRDKMTVCCGPSGSGKSSLAMDTIFAEGQRRYVESLSSYARQFLGQVQKPRVEHVSGLSPAIAIEQQTTSKSPRSTVGTVTEIYDYLRILFARLGQPHCPKCALAIGTQTSDEIIEKILNLPEGTRLYVMAPYERRGQEKYEAMFDEIRRSGFVRMRVDGKSFNVDAPPPIDHRRKHSIEVIVDRIIVRKNQRGRLADTVEAALDLGKGVMHVAHVDDTHEEPKWRVDRYSQHFACDQCGRSFEPLNPHHFSFNSVLGWCPACEGLGAQKGANPAVLVRDPAMTLRNGALALWPELSPEQPFTRFAEALARHGGFSLDMPWEQLDAAHQRILLYGTGEAWIELASGGRKPADSKKRAAASESQVADAPRSPSFQYKGVMPALSEATRVSFIYRQRLDYLVSDVPCSTCNGSRLRDYAAACKFMGHTIGELCSWPLRQVFDFFNKLDLTSEQRKIAGEVLREVQNRVRFLVDVGLDYVTLARSTPTLSGGESQRIRLASQIGSGLTGVLYVLDEPTIGLHPRDNHRLLQALNNLRDLGNTLVLVEHDREVITAADHLLDFGPGAGDLGGEITASGTPKQVMKAKASLTGQYLSGKKSIPVPTNRRIQSVFAAGERPNELVVRGARQNNLKNIDVGFPLGEFIAVTGVSGSGKSSLVHEILYNALARKLHRAATVVGAHDEIVGLDLIDKVINVDQDPLGNSPSSNPATYTGVFDLIRQLFAQLPDSRVRGWQPKRFSFNKPGGRCEACEGNGQKKIEMHFLPDVWVDCEICNAKRYNPETLAIKYKNKSIADVLGMRISEALELFTNIPKIRQILQTLADVGLEYLALGQPAPTLSGGEAQRVKLAAELARPNTGKTVYILDEPTTGLHFDDIRKLLDVLNRLVDLGNTVIVVEHNLDVIKTADWIIDLGPEAGHSGGRVVFAGPPELLAADTTISHTAKYVKEILAAGPHVERVKFDPLAAIAKREGDIALEKVGKDSAMPWQIDGRLWHTKNRLSGDGKPCHWDGEILTWIDEKIHALGDFAPTNWKHQSTVEIAASTKSLGWFFHAHTSMEWLVRLIFRVSKNTFKQEDLNRKLGLPTLNETAGIQVYSNEPRIHVANRKGLWQEVWMLIHKREEIETPAFDEFLRKAANSFLGALKKMDAKPEDVMPWKVNGERWHLSDKGFPPGRKLQWDRAILPRVLDVLRKVEPKLEIAWDNRGHIGISVPGVSRAWAYLRTKDSDVLNCRFLGKKGQFNLNQIDKFGIEPTLQSAAEGEAMVLQFAHDNHLHPRALREILAQHLAGFRNQFGESAS